jgi:hypothetical protein
MIAAGLPGLLPPGRRRAEHQAGETRMTSELKRIDGCELCRAARITRWYHEDGTCWIAECEICEVPMVVWRFHGVEPPADHLAHMRARLAEVATAELGEHYVDDHMRNIPDHWHAHARPRGGFFGLEAGRRSAR